MAGSKKTCSITGCDKPSKRSFSAPRINPSVNKVGLTVEDSRQRKTYLCREHWKQVKKAYKKARAPERMRWGP
ncbi:hypothetical protein EU537_07970 [Candidatus Thorarchaeota archaeon]|nr:MAG: hypothetical protein EU537_07970 [Candidatus Thorarchaeota archaeon]